jgi:putative membrane protein
MRALTWTIRIVAFVLLLALAAKNAEPVALRFYFGLAWQLPLIALLLAFFVAGALFGLAAALGTVLRQRREIGRLRREASPRAAAATQDALPPVAGP